MTTKKIFIPFAYKAHILRKRHRKVQRDFFGATAPVQIERISEGDAELAFRIEDWRNDRPLSFNVLHYRGRLWWPSGNGRNRNDVGRELLRDLINGRLYVFEKTLLGDDPRPRIENDVSVRTVVSSDHDKVLADIKKEMEDCLIIDDRLFVAGGVPILVAVEGEKSDLYVVNSASHLNSERKMTGLTVQAGRYGYDRTDDADEAILAGKFYLPNSAKLAREVARLPQINRKIPRVEAAIGARVNLFDIRVDAAFRVVWREIKYLEYALKSKYGWPGMESEEKELRGKPLRLLSTIFEQLRERDTPRLTDRRSFALLCFLNAFSKKWQDDLLNPVAAQGVRNLVRRAVRSGRFSKTELLESHWDLSTENEGNCEFD